MPSIKHWQRMAHDLAQEKGFYDGADTGDATWLTARLALIMCEVAEAIECVRRGQLASYRPEGEKPEGLPVELADIALRLFDLAESLDLDLEELIALKHQYNLTRARKHGKAL